MFGLGVIELIVVGLVLAVLATIVGTAIFATIAIMNNKRDD